MQCHYFDAGVCRSCTLMGVPYERQLAEKDAACRAALAGFADLEWDPPFASVESGFRNKAKLVVGGTSASPTLGILGPGGEGVDLRECGLYEEPIREALPVLAEFVGRAGLTPYDVASDSGELKYLLVTCSPHGDLMLRFVLRTTAELFSIRGHLDWLRRALPHLTVISANLQPERKAIIEGPSEVHLAGESRLPMTVGPVNLFLPPRSFFQTNTEVAGGLYLQARHWLDDIAEERGMLPSVMEALELDIPVGDELTIWDLYCGVGGFALSVVGPGRHITGVEVSEEAIEGARDAAELVREMSPGMLPVRFLSGDATAFAQEAAGHPHVVIVNPPRRGLGKLAEWLERSHAEYVVYSSCNVTSLLRDLGKMRSLVPVRARLFDMFPQTNHSEVMVLLRRQWETPPQLSAARSARARG